MGDVNRADAGDENICSMIITAVAEKKEVSPAELSPPLYDVIDPDALEALFAQKRGRATPTTLSFEYGDYAVTVLGEDEETIVDVQPLSTTTPTSHEHE